jgi:sporulation protein YlmC with PRC-barrel domain
VFLAKEVLDKGLVDRDGHKAGKVDDLILEIRDGHGPVVSTIRCGRGDLASHLGRNVEALAAWLRRHILGPEGDVPPAEIGWEHVTQIDVVVHLDLDRVQSDLIHTQNAIWARWVRRIPWAER